MDIGMDQKYFFFNPIYIGEVQMTVPGTSLKKELNMGEVQTGCISV